MHNTNHLFEILVALEAEKVEFIVAGGVAIVLQGIERATMDLDLSVRMDRGNLERFLIVMKRLGLTPRAPVPAETILDPELVEQMVKEKNAIVFTFIDLKNPFRQVDLFLKPELSYEALAGDVEKFTLSGHQVAILSKQKLISLKRQVKPLREKDQFDIQALERLIGEVR